MTLNGTYISHNAMAFTDKSKQKCNFLASLHWEQLTIMKIEENFWHKGRIEFGVES
jgi:hypothetical protein